MEVRKETREMVLDIQRPLFVLDREAGAVVGDNNNSTVIYSPPDGVEHGLAHAAGGCRGWRPSWGCPTRRSLCRRRPSALQTRRRRLLLSPSLFWMLFWIAILDLGWRLALCCLRVTGVGLSLQVSRSFCGAVAGRRHLGSLFGGGHWVLGDGMRERKEGRKMQRRKEGRQSNTAQAVFDGENE